MIFMAIRRLLEVESEASVESPHIYLLNNMQMISAKNVAPSINAAEISIAVWMLLAISGCRAMLSTAFAPMLPIP